MKKKIAVMANGWNYDGLTKMMPGLKRYAAQEDFDIFIFLSFACYSEHTSLMQGELNVYQLCDPSDFDGVIVLSAMLNAPDTAVSICRSAKEKGVPVISVGMEIEGISSICIRNRDGMEALVTHLVEKHGVKKVFFIAGTSDHVDSIERLRVTREVLARYGLALGEDQVGYGKWSNRHTADVLDELLSAGDELPDAIICANDTMAMTVCTELAKRGYDVPGNIIVTGFDSCLEGAYFYPALTTVEQGFEEAGFKACEMIYEQVKTGAGKRCLRIMLPSSLVLGESCGCEGNRDYNGIRLAYCRESFQRNAEAKLLEQNERTMRERISDVSDYQALRSALQIHYLKNHQFEGSGFYIVLNSEYYENVMASEQELWEQGFGERMEVVVALEDGCIAEKELKDRRILVPGYQKKDGEQHVYSFSPLHYYQYNYGYVVFRDEPEIMKDNMLYPYLEKLQQSLKLLRINLRLKRLYVRDPLTGLYNRFGYENIALPLYQASLQRKIPMTVMFVDVNYMKRINDKFGHIHGDNAIRAVTDAIKENLRENWIAVRFGGDEFLVIAPECDEKLASDVREAILRELDRGNREKTRPYEISVSCGYVVSDPKGRPDATLQDYIREADKVMYEVKAIAHAKDS